MPLTNEDVLDIENVLMVGLRNKFKNYKPETSSMPFHIRLLGKDRLALYSFIHSLNTNFGTSIFEPVGAAIAKKNFRTVKSHIIVGNQISNKAQIVIQKIIDNLSTANSEPDKDLEVDMIRGVCLEGEMVNVKPTVVDLMIESYEGEFFLFDIKTAKPNIGEFKGYKRTLLEWIAILLAKNPNLTVHTLIAIPYNPYEPQPYNRWTIRGMLDLNRELKVASEFWDFLGGEKTYEKLLDCFERVGIELRDEIDEYFLRF